MAVSNVSASSSFGSIGSAYGNAGWGLATATQIAANIQPGDGTVWAVWQIGIPGLPPGKAVTGIIISGPISFYVYGSGNTRSATLVADMFSNFNSFSGSGGSASMATLVANGQSTTLNYVFKKQGFTSDMLAAGQCYFGIAVATTGDNAPNGMGSFSFGALSWSIYTAPDDPAPPSGATSSKLTNPAANFNPGVFPGGQFAPLTSQLLGPLPQQYYSAAFGVPFNKGFVFVDNGSNSQIIRQQGYTNNPSSPYICNSGIITVAANTVPGVYTFQCACSGLSFAEPPAQTVYTQVTVRDRAKSRLMLSEA